MSDYEKNLAYPTSRIAEELLRIAERLEENDANWVKNAASRMTVLQSLCMPSTTIKKGESYSVKVTTDDEGFRKNFFNVLLPFNEAVKYATDRFGKKGLGVKSVEIKRDDEEKDYEPYTD